MKHLLLNADAYYEEAFKNNIGLLSEEEQKKLRNSKVAVAGMGGAGGAHLVALLRLGIGKFNIADMNNFEPGDLQRQYGAYMDTMGQNKSEVMRKVALSINPHLDIKSFPEGLFKNNIDRFLSEVDILIDGIDFFSIEERRMIFREAKEKGVYAITAGSFGFGSAMLIFSPNGMGFDEYFDLNDNMSYMEKIIAYCVGMAPAAIHTGYFGLDSIDIDKKRYPPLVSSCELSSALVVTEAINILLKRQRPLAAPYYFQFDPYLKSVKQGYLGGGNRNWIQKFRRWHMKKKLLKKGGNWVRL